MHMMLVMLGGMLLLAVFALFGWLWGHDLAGAAFAARAFIPVWLVVACVNLWVGVTRAGFTVVQELPILAANFAVPAAAAGLLAWQLARG